MDAFGNAFKIRRTILARVGGEGLIVDINHLLDRNAVFFAKAKSRSSCAGTPITAPSP